MPLLDQWELTLTVSDVLKAQGADPDIISVRRPSLLKITQEAIDRGVPLLQPRVVYEKYQVKNFVHERVELIPKSADSRKPSLSGPLIAQHLSRAEEIIVMVCTIGGVLDEVVSGLFKTDPVHAVGLDGVGSAAVEYLGIQACNYFEAQVKTVGLNTTIPLNPGMLGWPVEQGQPEIFTLLDSDCIGVSLNETCMMVPNKSLSMVVGIGKDLSQVGIPCDYCSLNGVCKYQNHYAR